MLNKKIAIFTTGQPSTNPRMVKEYQALKALGYQVNVFYSYWQNWACTADQKMFASNDIVREDFILIGGSPFTNKCIYFATKTFYKITKLIHHQTGLLSNFALSRTTYGLIYIAKKTKADLYIAHNNGALPAAVIGAKKNNAKCAFDAEDFHRGEYKDQNQKPCADLIAIENKFLPLCDYVTAASPLIAAAYKNLYSKLFVEVINNVFSLAFLQQIKYNNDESLSLFWFSQTIGPNRGLEKFVKALNKLPADYKVDLYLMGQISKGFDVVLSNLSERKNIYFLKTVSPDEIFVEAAKYDIGLCIEEPYFINRDICLTNKIFTYLLAGNCILFSDTKAQKLFWQQNEEIGFLFSNGDQRQIAAILYDLYQNRDKIFKAKKASLELAHTKMNWEMESMKLVKLVARTI